MAVKESRKEMAVNLYAAGMSSDNIAATLRCSPSTVLNWVGKTDVPKRKAWDSHSMYSWKTYGRGR